MIDTARHLARERRYRRARFDALHAGHDITTRGRRGLDGHLSRRCLTCENDTDAGAIQRAAAGDPPPNLTRAERRAAVAQLRPHLPAALIAARLRVADRTVWRDIAAIRTGATR